MDTEFKTLAIREETKKALDRLKIHPKQSYDELINKLINEADSSAEEE